MNLKAYGFRAKHLLLSYFKLILVLSLCISTSFGCKEKKSDDKFKIVLRLSHVFSPKEDISISMDKVAQRVLEKTKGAVKILTYPQGQIATYKDGVELVVRGAYFISAEDPSYIGDYVPEFTALVGPMLYRNYDEFISLVKTPLVQGWIKKAEKKGIKILSLQYIFGFRNLITNKVIKTPKDLSGLKLRTPGSKLFIETLNAMGATATPLPWGETFSAIQQGVVDGLEGSEFTNINTKTYETGKKNVALTNHFLGTAGIYISMDVWNKIPTKYRTIIEQEFVFEADEMVNSLKSKHAGVVSTLESHGVKFNEIDRAAFEKETNKLFNGNLPGVNIEMYNKIQTELKKIRRQSNGTNDDKKS